MPKNNKKTEKDTKNPHKLKVLTQLLMNDTLRIQELGNKAFVNKSYDEAIAYYSKAIEVERSDPTFFTNSIKYILDRND